jgi:hypothetical protein
MKINKDIYKKLCRELKNKMNSGDMEAFKKYSLLVKDAKKL